MKTITHALLALPFLLLTACDEDPTGGPGADGGPPPGTDAGAPRPGEDGGPGSDDAGPGGGDAGPGGGDDGGMMPPPTASACAEITDAIIAGTGRTVTVSPAGDGEVTVDGRTTTLRAVVREASEGDTILLEDGTYTIAEAGPGDYTGLYFTTPNVTLRSASGDASAVIIDSAYRLHGGGSGTITIAAANVVVASVTVRRSVYHLIHLWADGDDALIHDVHLVDGGQQFLKASPGDAARVDGVEVSCSEFRMTDAGRDNVWGYGATDGNTTCYTGGIDTHDSRDWHVHDSYFEGIYCDADGPRRPAHGQSPSERGDQTYVGGLAEHAIHMWDSESGSGHVIERNVIVNCARGIGLGFRTEIYGAVVRNNAIFSSHASSREHDVGIMLDRLHDGVVEHNTVFFSHPDAYPNRIEYRYGSTSNLTLRNNLTNGQLRARDGASASLAGNVTSAEAGWFRDPAGGDLRLASCDLPSVVGAGEAADVTVDIEGEARGGSFDVGADHCSE